MGLAPRAQVVHALGRMAAYSMLAIDTQGMVTVHRMVQQVARTPQPGDLHRDPAQIEQARQESSQPLGAAIPGDTQDPGCWPAWRELAVQVAAFAQHAPAHTDTQHAAYLLDRTGSFLKGQGSLPQALSHLHRAVDDYERLHGPEGALASRNNLANAYYAAGQYGRATELHEQTLTLFERVLGPDHPDTLASRNNLAEAYRAAGEHERAVELHEQTLAVRERILGPEHPHTLNSRNNLRQARAAAELDDE